MNPLTLVKRTQKINSTEAALGISEEASWHARYKDSAYIFVGGIPYDLTEGDLLAVFAQYGEIVDVNLVRDKSTGKSKGFAFLAYEDQRSTILAVDNLNGAKILGRIVRVDHVSSYKKKEEEDEEKEQQKREARGVCHAYQRGECNRGASCKFSHDEQRCADSAWGPKESNSRWDHNRYGDHPKGHKNLLHGAPDQTQQGRVIGGESKSKSRDKDGHHSLRSDAFEEYSYDQRKQSDLTLKNLERRGSEKSGGRLRDERKSEDDTGLRRWEKHIERSKLEPNQEDDPYRRGSGRWPKPDRDSSSRYCVRKEEEEYRRRSHR
ncbi:zinc finger CCCH domain-containing protein 25 [Phoenix dactylifera]|uniref:Zinc finger CCCH domain-containing protein 25 n=1 Tax=Phoenix dactylifera TaxID=42345 RepID=A0A8B7BU28_PHODC|nr:zinc finger CCCH domain-containing protein 25 [Phoenix dactylifera]XP_008785369.1 zinc finger CCCH domain-containing protein 25 [Phoenix dactylifera]